MEHIGSRKSDILHALISEYIFSAEPVSSELIAEKYHLGVSSATIRNELADLENIGLLEQPHISSGRIPSDIGYRYYVDSIITTRIPDLKIRKRVQNVSREGNALQDLLLNVTSILSELTHLLSTAVIYHNREVKVVHVMASTISSRQLILLLVLNNGQVINKLVDYDLPLSAQDIECLNKILESKIINSTLEEVLNLNLKYLELGLTACTELALGNITNTLRFIARELTQGDIIVQGKEFLFAQPESKRCPHYIDNLIHSLSNREIIYNALSQSETSSYAVLIGRENKAQYLYPFALVKQNFYSGQNEVGSIAIMGPTRLNYKAYIPLVEYAAQSITHTLSHYALS